MGAHQRWWIVLRVVPQSVCFSSFLLLPPPPFLLLLLSFLSTSIKFLLSTWNHNASSRRQTTLLPLTFPAPFSSPVTCASFPPRWPHSWHLPSAQESVPASHTSSPLPSPSFKSFSPALPPTPTSPSVLSEQMWALSDHSVLPQISNPFYF